MKNLYPLKLNYIAKSAIWGGVTLRESWGKESDLPNIAETWELTVREKENSVIQNGECRGMTLDEYIKKSGNAVVAENYDGERFPLLIKFIDADDKLSVQVHPNDDYALANENDPGKTEMWYIVDAKEGAEIIYGLRDGVSAEDFAAAVKAGNISGGMKYVKVKKGETYFIPSGMLHAIGEGILIAEIQQNSDLTYRVYDYDRRQADGSLRQLHIEKALDVTRPFSEDEVNAIRFEAGREDRGGEQLAHCRYFEVNRFDIDGEITLNADKKSFKSLLSVDGEGEIVAGGVSYPISRGESYFIPAGMGEFTLKGKTSIIVSEV